MRGEEVLASVEVADTARARLRGLLGRDDPAGPAGQGDAAGSAGALLLTPARAVHTCAMRFAVDV
ncbi:MAG TPA: hypothetical protein DEP69_04265, partial [Acidimicrobiaceae bacterium]|nr:hypothetical protein [Acidimicrobiaceae bacterium]